jgi:hypothetical protein
MTFPIIEPFPEGDKMAQRFSKGSDVELSFSEKTERRQLFAFMGYVRVTRA